MRSARARWIAGLLGATALAAAAVVWDPLGWTADQANEAEAQLYTCPMHPHVLQHGPGTCPLCKMDLVPVRQDPPLDGAGMDAAADTHTHSAGDTHTHSDEDPNAAPGEAGSPGGSATSLVSVHVDPAFLQNFGVRTAQVQEGSLDLEIRTVGYLAHDDEAVFSVNTKFGGWIEEAHVATVGERVSEGDVLFEIYSPELVTSQWEYISAIEYAERLRQGDAHADAVRQAESLTAAARERLRSWDMTPRQIAELETTREPSRTVEFVSPVSGFLVDKTGDSLEGLRLSPGMTVLKFANHHTLWVEVEFHEHDVRHLREGQRVVVTVDAFPERRWDGTILFFRPAMNQATRTLTAFVKVDNQDLQLRPKMFANVVALVPGTDGAVLVPSDAVLHTGGRSVVIVAEGAGRFTPREVRLGLSAGGRQQVLEGLATGETIVTTSQFLFDSESNLRAAIARMTAEARTGQP